MIEIQKGMMVFSKAGHDKGRYYAVVDFDDTYAYIADGMERKLNKPKKKKFMHLSFTKTVFNPQDLETDNKLRKAIKLRFSQG